LDQLQVGHPATQSQGHQQQNAKHRLQEEEACERVRAAHLLGLHWHLCAIPDPGLIGLGHGCAPSASRTRTGWPSFSAARPSVTTSSPCSSPSVTARKAPACWPSSTRRSLTRPVSSFKTSTKDWSLR